MTKQITHHPVCVYFIFKDNFCRRLHEYDSEDDFVLL